MTNGHWKPYSPTSRKNSRRAPKRHFVTGAGDHNNATNMATGYPNIATGNLSENKRTVDDQVRAKVKPRMSKELIREYIVKACVVEHSVDELSALLNKSLNYLRNFIIPDMVAEGILIRTKPEHSRGQTYIAVHNPDEQE